MKSISIAVVSLIALTITINTTAKSPEPCLPGIRWRWRCGTRKKPKEKDTITPKVKHYVVSTKFYKFR